MIHYFNMKHEVGETILTDFNEGSEIRNILEAFAVCIYALLEEQHEATRIAFISSSYGMWLDRIGEMPFIDLPRIVGTEASGVVTFTLSEEQESDYVIPAGTVLTDSKNNLDFETLLDATVFEGETTVTAPVQCITIGSDGNVPANNIDTISSNIDTDLVSVNNGEALTGGTDYEDDDSYRSRLLSNVQSEGFGSLPYYKQLCESVDGVHDVIFVSDADYTKKVLVNGSTKPTPGSVLLDVLSELTLSRNCVLGHNFIIDKPAYTTVDLDITLTVVTEMDTDILMSSLVAFVDGRSFDRLEYTGLSINQPLTKVDMVDVLSIFPQIVEVTSIESDGSEVTILQPAPGGVLKLGAVTFTQNTV